MNETNKIYLVISFLALFFLCLGLLFLKSTPTCYADFAVFEKKTLDNYCVKQGFDAKDGHRSGPYKRFCIKYDSVEDNDPTLDFYPENVIGFLEEEYFNTHENLQKPLVMTKHACTRYHPEWCEKAIKSGEIKIISNPESVNKGVKKNE